MTAALKKKFARQGLYWITHCIVQGGYPEEDDFKLLRSGGVTHLFNVDLPYQDRTSIDKHGFTGVVCKPIVDGQRIPDAVARDCLDALHGILSADNTKVYLHCHAGINRSPTLIWLYLIACGLKPNAARELIVSAAPHAVAGHPSLCDFGLYKSIEEYGRSYYRPLKRPDILSTALK
jgi:hypothetical protein